MLNSTPELAAMSRPGRARYRAIEIARDKYGKKRWHREKAASPFYGRGFLLKKRKVAKKQRREGNRLPMSFRSKGEIPKRLLFYIKSLERTIER